MCLHLTTEKSNTGQMRFRSHCTAFIACFKTNLPSFISLQSVSLIESEKSSVNLPSLEMYEKATRGLQIPHYFLGRYSTLGYAAVASH